jgi:hypothetical protein
MKKLIVILFAFATVMLYDAVFGHFELGKELFSEKKVKMANQVTNEMSSADTIALTSCKEKQFSQFSELIRILKRSPYVFNLIKIDLSNGYEPYDMEKPPVTIEQLSEWALYDFIYLEFPDGFCNEQPGKLAISCNNYNRKNPKFVAAINTVRETSYGSSKKSIPYYTIRTGKELVQEIEEQRYILEAIKHALDATTITVMCDEAASALIYMEQEQKLRHKPPSAMINKDTFIWIK